MAITSTFHKPMHLVPAEVRAWVHQWLLRVRMGDAPTRGRSSVEWRDPNDLSVRWSLDWYESKYQPVPGFVETLWTLTPSHEEYAHFRDISDNSVLEWIDEAERALLPKDTPLETKPETYGAW